ncbi:MAG: LON peptidase substrate-binding domain-containing protein [Burkholderiaceae bacterium]|nr:LON peptidase substrate-binding domain-containing protein [Burkholderiaceae bacterium]
MTAPLSLTSLPLFPLETVLYPGGTLALRVFEVRYLTMVRKCHEAGAPFGVVCLQAGSEVRRAGAPTEQLSAVGTLAHVQTLEAPQAGLLLARCHGSQRFRVKRQTQLPHGLWIADVEQIPDDLSTPVPAHLARTARLLAPVLASLHERQGAAAGEPASAEQLGDSGWVANRWCELLPMPSDLKQRMMELESPLVRLELVADMLTSTGIAPGA